MSTLKHLRSSTADKRPAASGMADGQIAINTASGTPGLYIRDTASGVVKIGPAHVGSGAPNATPAGSVGNSIGEFWIDTNTATPGLKYYNGSSFVNLTPSGTTTTVGLVELATPAETQAGTDGVRAVTPSGLQSKVSDSISTTSSTTIASATAVKTAYDLANAALPRTGGTLTGELLISPSGSLIFEGSSDDSFETVIAVTNPTADRTITFPDTTGTVITSADVGTVTSAMIANGAITNDDINASAGIVDTKLATISTAGKVSNSATTAASANTANAIVARDASGNFSAGTITASLTGNASTSTALSSARTFALTGNVTGSVSSDLTSGASISTTIASGVVTSAMIADGAIINADVNASAAIAGTKISPDFGGQNVTTSGTSTAASFIPSSSAVPTNGVYLPAANSVAISTNGTGRLFVSAGGNIGINTSTPTDFGATYRTLEVKGTTGGGVFRASGDVTTVDLYAESGAGGLGILRTLGAHPLAFHTNSTEKLRITSDGRLGLGTSSPYSRFTVLPASTPTTVAGADQITIGEASANSGYRLQIGYFNAGANGYMGSIQTYDNGTADGELILNGLGGRVGIGSTAPGNNLTVAQAGTGVTATSEIYAGTIGNASTTNVSKLLFSTIGGGGGVGNASISHLIDSSFVLRYEADSGHQWYEGGSEAMRIDTSRRLLIGTPTSINGPYAYAREVQFNAPAGLQLSRFSVDAFSSRLTLVKSRNATTGSHTVVSSGDALGELEFGGSDGTAFIEAGRIAVQVDGTPGTNDMPGRIVFSTTADGASSPTERMRITSAGRVGIANTSPTATLSFDNTIDTNGFDVSKIHFFNDLGGNIVGLGTSAGQLNYRGAGSHVWYNGTTERARIDSSGRLLVGTSSALASAFGTVSPRFQVATTTSGPVSFLSYANDAFASRLDLSKSRGTTVGTNTIVADGDDLGDIYFNGADGTNFIPAALIRGEVDGTPGTNDMPGRLVFSTTADGASSPTERLRIDSTGFISLGGDTNTGFSNPSADNLALTTGGSERARIDSSGRLLVGTSSALTVGGTSHPLQVEGTSHALSCVRHGGTTAGNASVITFGRSRGTTNGSVTAVADGDALGYILFTGANGADFSNVGAQIHAVVDGAPFTSGDTTDLPSRLVFSTSSDSSASPTERVRITSGGYFKASNSGGYYGATALAHEFRQTLNERTFVLTSTNASYSQYQTALNVDRAADTAYSFLECLSGNFADREFNLRGDGTGFCDGSWTGGGADYAEYFEWSDGNPNAEDRRGISVVLDGEKIRPALAGEDPIGVISGNPSVVGDAAWNKWSGKYLRDEFGTYILEDYEVTDDDGNTVVQQRRKLNPAYDPDAEYISREQRPEWDCVGLMGKLRLRKGQPTGSRWIKMRDVSADVEEWLVR